jgi:hypothetical protein
LVKANPEAQYELTKVAAGVQIVRKEPEPVAAPVSDEDVFFAVMPVRSIKTKQVWFWDNGKAACIDGKNLLGYNLGDDDKVTIKVPLAYAKWAGLDEVSDERQQRTRRSVEGRQEEEVGGVAGDCMVADHRRAGAGRDDRRRSL